MPNDFKKISGLKNMLKKKQEMPFHFLFVVVFSAVLHLLFYNLMPTNAMASATIRDDLKKRIETEIIKNRFSCRGELICGVSLIPTFYKRRNYVPAWFKDNNILPQVEELMDEINGAQNEGLQPDDYHLGAIVPMIEHIHKNKLLGMSTHTAMWVDLDLLLTDAFMLFGSHLLAGRVNPETIHTDWIVGNLSVDLIDILQSALGSNQVGQALRDLRPSHPGYTRLKQFLVHYREKAKNGNASPLSLETSLRKGDSGISVRRLYERLNVLGDIEPSTIAAIDIFDEVIERAVQKFQKRHGLKSDGIVGQRTLAMLNTPIQQRVRQIELNMERWRWFPRDLGRRYILVNVANFTLRVVENHQNILRTRVVVGRPFRRTPVFSSNMTYMVVNPFWNIPTSIAIKDILPKVKQETSYLSQQGIKIFENWRKGALELSPETIDWSLIEPKNFSFKLRQDPGHRNALGRIKFMFPNKFAVYLHDTPKRSLFEETVRDFSSGCIRIERPMDVASYLLTGDPQWTKEKLLKIIEAGERQTIKLKRPITVHLQYWTAWVDDNNVLHFRDDIYDRDKPLARALKERLPGV